MTSVSPTTCVPPFPSKAINYTSQETVLSLGTANTSVQASFYLSHNNIQLIFILLNQHCIFFRPLELTENSKQDQ